VILVYDHTALIEPNLLIPGKKPIGPVKLDKTHPFLRGCTGYFPFVGNDVHNLITGKPVTITATPPERKIVGGNQVWEFDDSVYFTADVSNASSYTCIFRGYIANPSVQWAFFGTISGSTGFEMVSGIDNLWWANEADFNINYTGEILSVNQPYTFAIKYDENAATETTILFERAVTDTSAIGGGAATVGNLLQIGARGDGVLGGQTGCEYLYLFDRAIANEECYRIMSDPYQPLIPVG